MTAALGNGSNVPSLLAYCLPAGAAASAGVSRLYGVMVGNGETPNVLLHPQAYDPQHLPRFPFVEGLLEDYLRLAGQSSSTAMLVQM